MNQASDTRDVGGANLRFARALVDELHAAGIAAAVVSPGSRSTPLALSVAQQAGLPRTVHIDERNAAFHALGYAKATGRPVALVCTSGTAGANFLPAVAEAHHARVPLVVLTADRPPELRAWGAAQTMEQRLLYAGFTRWSEEAPCPSECAGSMAYARALARRAVSEATGPAPGPVHLNLPFREPLVPASGEVDLPPARGTPETQAALVHELCEASGTLARRLRAVARGVLVCGPDTWDEALPAAVRQFVATHGWPVLADPCSGLRAGAAMDDGLVHGADALLRDPDTAAALRPDLVVRFGGLPVSKAINDWIGSHPSADLWLVDPAAGFRDPQHRASRVLRASPSQFCTSFSRAGGPAPEALAWREQWRHVDRAAREALAGALERESRFLAPQLAQTLWASLPDDAVLYAANSMAIREIDAFAGPRAGGLRVLANRGVNGIDGQVSAALGAAAGLRRRTVLWCGDLTLLHDVSGLLAGRLHDADLTIVVSNDDGGGIFEYLPVAQAVPRPVFEEMFAVPHGLRLDELARGLGWEAVRATSAQEFERALSGALQGGRHVIEVPMDRAANTALHGALTAAVRSRLRTERLP